MKKINILVLIPIILITLSGCGSSIPGGSNSGSVTLAVNFPQQSAGGPAALISGSTSYFKVWVWDNTWNILGYTQINAPAGGGIVNTTISLNPYAGPAWIEVWGYKANGNGNSYMLNSINILPQNNQAQLTVVEMGQGIAVAPGSSLISPDNTTYNINNIFLDTTSVVGVQGNYKLGIQVTNLTTASTGYFLSTNNIDQLNSIMQHPYIINGAADFDIDVPNAARTIWNRYYFTIDFNNGINGAPTNTPTITGTFRGTLTFNPVGAVIPATGTFSTPGASGSITMNIPNASWSNAIAPPPQTQSTILFYTQSQQTSVPAPKRLHN